MKNKWITARRIFFSALVFIAAGAGYGAAWHTFVPWWEPVLWSLGFAAVLSPICCKAISRALAVSKRWIALPATTLALWAFAYGALMNINYFCADHASTSQQTAVVISKHSEQRTRYRRSGRRVRTIPDGTYNVYYVTVRFDNGVCRDMPVSASKYAKAKRGDTKQFALEKGFFGYTIFKNAQESK